MLLTPQNIVHYLLYRNYLQIENVVNNEFTVRMSMSRNHNFVVNKEQETAYFVKQPVSFEAEKINSLRTEATVYWLAENEPEYAPLREFLPPFHEYDQKNHILTLGYLHRQLDLEVFYHQNRVFPLAIAQAQAELLHRVHHQIFDAVGNEGKSRKLFRQGLPMVFYIVGPGSDSWMQDKTPRVQQMMQLILRDETFVRLIETVKNEWEMSSLIHGDIKNSNFLINADCLEKDDYQLRLLDWEIADMGDPLWDIAAVLQSYLLPWVFKETVGQQPAYVQSGQKIGFDLVEMQPSVQIFWQHYSHLMGFSAEEEGQKLLKATRFCALKLIHSCLEAAQYSSELPPQSATMLQLSLNILKDPEAAVQGLFNLELSNATA